MLPTVRPSDSARTPRHALRALGLWCALLPGAMAQDACSAAAAWPLWEQFTQRFMQDDGRVIDYTTAQQHSTSEGQSYAMFFALVANQPERFERLWRWSVTNLAGGNVAARLPADRRAFASGFINAGGSFGQFVFAPLSQWLIAGFGWVTALFGLAAVTLLTIPLAWPLRHKAEHPEGGAAVSGGMGDQLRVAFADRSYWCLHAGFLTCGFHIAFLATHLPGAVDLCGLPGSVSANSLALIGLANIVGGLAAGWACQRYRMKWLLFGMYASRAVMVGLYLVAPKTDLTFYLFAFGLGLTWLATVPPTAGLVGKLFGLRYLGTLFGLTLLSHQIGAFFGAWLGGIALVESGNYDWMWYADMVLAGLAALVNLPIREEKLQPAACGAR